MNSPMTSQAATAREAERLHVDHAVAQRLGRWTSASRFDARVRYGVLVLDLRSPDVTGDIEVRLDLQRSTLKLLLAEGDQVDRCRSRRTSMSPVTSGERRSRTRTP